MNSARRTLAVFLCIFLPALLALAGITAILICHERTAIYNSFKKEQAAWVGSVRDRVAQKLYNEAYDLILLAESARFQQALTIEDYDSQRQKVAEVLSSVGHGKFVDGLLLLGQEDEKLLWLDTGSTLMSRSPGSAKWWTGEIRMVASSVRKLERDTLYVTCQRLSSSCAKGECEGSCAGCSNLLMAVQGRDPSGRYRGALAVVFKGFSEVGNARSGADQRDVRVLVQDSQRRCFRCSNEHGQLTSAGIRTEAEDASPAILKEEWNRIENEENGGFLGANGFVTFVTLDPLREMTRWGIRVAEDVSGGKGRGEAGPYRWRIASLLPVRAISRSLHGYLLSLFILNGFLALVSGVGSWSLALSIVRRREAMSALTLSEQRYRTLAESAQDMIFILDSLGQVQYANASALAIFGEGQEGSGKVTIGQLIPFLGRDELVRAIDRVFTESLPVTVVSEIKLPSGQRIWLDTKLVPIRENRKVIKAIMGISRDITDKKRSEDMVVSSLREKEILLKEIHHRVKNNLHAVSGLLSLQSYVTCDRDSATRFRTTQNQVISMALVHERLCQAQDSGRIDFVEYARNLAEHLKKSILTRPDQVAIRVVGADVPINMDTAIPCGLIINELITNAMKYAFPDGGDGEVSIGISRIGENQFRLEVRDNGVGLPLEMVDRNFNTTGLRLVRDLVEQLRGEMEMEVFGGTTYRITFAEYMECGTELHHGK